MDSQGCFLKWSNSIEGVGDDSSDENLLVTTCQSTFSTVKYSHPCWCINLIIEFWIPKIKKTEWDHNMLWSSMCGLVYVCHEHNWFKQILPPIPLSLRISNWTIVEKTYRAIACQNVGSHMVVMAVCALSCVALFPDASNAALCLEMSSSRAGRTSRSRRYAR